MRCTFPMSYVWSFLVTHALKVYSGRVVSAFAWVCMWMVSPGRTIIAWGRITTGVLQLGACGGASMFDDIDINDGQEDGHEHPRRRCSDLSLSLTF